MDPEESRLRASVKALGSRPRRRALFQGHPGASQPRPASPAAPTAPVQAGGRGRSGAARTLDRRPGGRGARVPLLFLTPPPGPRGPSPDVAPEAPAEDPGARLLSPGRGETGGRGARGAVPGGCGGLCPTGGAAPWALDLGKGRLTARPPACLALV